MKSEQNGSDFRHCLKSEQFGNGTTLESAKIQTLGFQMFTVMHQINVETFVEVVALYFKSIIYTE